MACGVGKLHWNTQAPRPVGTHKDGGTRLSKLANVLKWGWLSELYMVHILYIYMIMDDPVLYGTCDHQFFCPSGSWLRFVTMECSKWETLKPAGPAGPRAFSKICLMRIFQRGIDLGLRKPRQDPSQRVQNGRGWSSFCLFFHSHTVGVRVSCSDTPIWMGSTMCRPCHENIWDTNS